MALWVVVASNVVRGAFIALPAIGAARGCPGGVSELSHVAGGHGRCRHQSIISLGVVIIYAPCYYCPARHVAAAGRRPAGRVSPPHTAQLTPQLAGRLRLGLHHRLQPQAPHPPPRVPARVCPPQPMSAPAHPQQPRALPPPASRHPPRRPPREHAHMLPLQPPPSPQEPQVRPGRQPSVRPAHRHAVPKTSSPTCPTISLTSSPPRPSGPCGIRRGPSTRRTAVRAAPTTLIAQS